MPRFPAPVFRPGPLSRADAENLNRLARDLYSLKGNFTAGPGIDLIEDSTGVHIQLGIDPDIYGQITGPLSAGTYPFEQVIWNPALTTPAWVPVPGGLVATAADINGSTTVATGTRVRIWNGPPPGDWWFSTGAAAATGINLDDASGTIVISAATDLFAENYLNISPPGSHNNVITFGVVAGFPHKGQIVVQDASASNRGVVTTGTQSFNGNKTVIGTVGSTTGAPTGISGAVFAGSTVIAGITMQHCTDPLTVHDVGCISWLWDPTVLRGQVHVALLKDDSGGRPILALRGYNGSGTAVPAYFAAHDAGGVLEIGVTGTFSLGSGHSITTSGGIVTNVT